MKLIVEKLGKNDKLDRLRLIRSDGSETFWDLIVPDTVLRKNKTLKDVAAGELNTDIVVSARIPPTLLIHANDDTVDPMHYSEVYARALKKAGVDVTLKLYETGGHAFGVSKQGKDTDQWMDDALGWMREKQIL